MEKGPWPAQAKILLILIDIIKESTCKGTLANPGPTPMDSQSI